MYTPIMDHDEVVAEAVVVEEAVGVGEMVPGVTMDSRTAKKITDVLEIQQLVKIGILLWI